MTKFFSYKNPEIAGQDVPFDNVLPSSLSDALKGINIQNLTELHEFIASNPDKHLEALKLLTDLTPEAVDRLMETTTQTLEQASTIDDRCGHRKDACKIVERTANDSNGGTHCNQRMYVCVQDGHSHLPS